MSHLPCTSTERVTANHNPQSCCRKTHHQVFSRCSKLERNAYLKLKGCNNHRYATRQLLNPEGTKAQATRFKCQAVLFARLWVACTLTPKPIPKGPHTQLYFPKSCTTNAGVTDLRSQLLGTWTLHPKPYPIYLPQICTIITSTQIPST